MALKYVEDVAKLFRAYAQEPRDLSEASLQTYLSQGYEEFREFVVNIDPSVFSTKVALTASGAYIDLTATNPKLMGSSVTSGRLLKAVRLGIDASNGSFACLLHPAHSHDELNAGADRWMLDGQYLRFSGETSATYLFEYIPESSVDWTETSVGDNEWIDDLTPYHDIIALYALRHYYIYDEAENAPALRSIDRREADLARFLMRRNVSASQAVSDVRGNEYMY